MARRRWLVMIANEPIPHEAARFTGTKAEVGPEVGPWYSAGGRWYAPGFGPHARTNERHVAESVKSWRERGFDVTSTVEYR
jgi:hypothetical protein